MKRTILGIDPGRSKCGLAVVEGERKSTSILLRKVCEIDDLKSVLREAADHYKLHLVAVGDGTNSKLVQNLVREAIPGHSILILDERDTSIRARERYWEHTPRRGWRLLLPSSLQVPPVPIDDFVAVILAEMVLKVD